MTEPSAPVPVAKTTPASHAQNDPSPTGAEKRTRLLLVCHGEGLYDRFANLSHVLVTDEGGLSAAGWEQANILAEWLRTHESIDYLVSGSQLRSRLTGQRISQILQIPLHVVQTLPNHLTVQSSDLAGAPPNALPRPGSHAHLAGKSEPVPGDPDSIDPTNAQESPPNASPPASGDGSARPAAAMAWENAPLFRQSQAALDELIADHWGETILLVTHSQVIAALISAFFGANNLNIQIDATSISELRWSKERWQLIYLNRHEHLPCPQLEPTATPVARPEGGEEEAHLDSVRRLFNRVATVYARSKQETDVQRIQNLVRFADLPKNLDILDVGTGPGTLAFALVNDGANLVLGVDISEAMLEQAEYLRLSSARPEQAARLGFRLGSAHNLPFGNERFDAVFCRLVLQYLTHPRKSIQEISRVLKPGGVLILAELLSADDPVKRATQNAIEERRDAGHVAARSGDQYRKLLTDAGLVVERVETQSFDRELNEWLTSLDTEADDRAVVREMLEAGLETDAAGLNARLMGETLFFDQRMIYLKAVKG